MIKLPGKLTTNIRWGSTHPCTKFHVNSDFVIIVLEENNETGPVYIVVDRKGLITELAGACNGYSDEAVGIGRTLRNMGYWSDEEYTKFCEQQEKTKELNEEKFIIERSKMQLENRGYTVTKKRRKKT